MNEDIKGNLTTIIKFIVMTLAPAIGLSEATSNDLIVVLVAIIGFALAYFDARYSNTFITKDSCDTNAGETD